MHLGKFLEKYRLSAAKFSLIVGITRGAVYSLIKGEKSASLLTTIKILIISNKELDMEELLCFSDKKKLKDWLAERKDLEKLLCDKDGIKLTSDE